MPARSSQNIFQSFVKVVMLLVIFGFFPVFLAIVVYNYNTNASSLIKITNALDQEYSSASTGLVVLTQEQANVLRKINEFSVGVWIDKKDVESKTVINPDNTFAEYKEKSRIAFGTWRAKIIQDKEGEAVQTRYMLQKNHLEQNKRVSILYEIVQLDTELFVLKAIASGSTEEINKAFDSATGTDFIYRYRFTDNLETTITLLKATTTFDMPRE